MACTWCPGEFPAPSHVSDWNLCLHSHPFTSLLPSQLAYSNINISVTLPEKTILLCWWVSGRQVVFSVPHVSHPSSCFCAQCIGSYHLPDYGSSIFGLLQGGVSHLPYRMVWIWRQRRDWSVGMDCLSFVHLPRRGVVYGVLVWRIVCGVFR